MSCSKSQSRRRAHVGIGLLTAVMFVLAGQGTVYAAEQQHGESRIAESSHSDHLGLLRLLDELRSVVVESTDNNDWQ
ncbi:hypothetical protein ACFP51_00140 [Streptomyces pratens]|uniref:Uncharacterized protein n=1 Tax=Streptomyces pratens TaxID=887456 RepID=A0ABW1LSR2_9ACTN